MTMLFWIFFILSGVLTWIAYRIYNSNDGADDGDDGGLPIDWSPPELDLPPGVTLPTSEGPEHTRLLEEEVLF